MTRAHLTLVGLLVGAAACADNQSLLIIQNQVAQSGCSIPATISTSFRGFGRLDVTEVEGISNPGYLFTPVLQNAIAGSSDNPNLNIVLVQGADVELSASTTEASTALVATLAGAGANLRTHRISASVRPNATAGIAFPAIDEDQTTLINGALAEDDSVQLIARVRVFGTLNGSEIVTPTFDYPITVCKGCLIENVGDCTMIPEGTEIEEGGVCNLFQDDPVTCCESTGVLVCPADAP
jgi:hypothetical protein